LKVKLARAQLALGQHDAARGTLDAVLKDDPGHPQAKALQQQLEHKSGS
jgi:TolA-binding protein